MTTTTKGAFAEMAVPGAAFAVRAPPGARKPLIRLEEGIFRIAVTAPPEDGRANAAVAESLAHALGVAKSRLTLVRGASARDKTFRLE
jgi:uncharacterized protein YggU (UPF0235/DUF167 family)